MIWLIGNKGMLGSDVEQRLQQARIRHITSDIETDITNPEALRSFIKDKKISWIINCSAYTAVDKAEDESKRAFKINADGVHNIAIVAKEHSAKLVHLSTDYVFDGQKVDAYKEDDEPNPATVYGASKLAGEKHVINTLSDYFIIRIAWLYGHNGSNFIHTMLRLFAERDEVRVVDDQWGSPTCTIDVADLIMLLIQSKSEAFGLYHFTNEGKTNWHEFAENIYAFAKQYGLIKRDVKITPIKTEEYPTKAKRPINSYLSKNKIKSMFNIRIRNWREALDEFIKQKTDLD